MKSDIRAVVFDLGGVLIGNGGPEMMMRLTGLHSEELWSRWLRSPAVRGFEAGRIDPAAFVVQVISEFRLNIEPSEFFYEFSNWLVPLAGAVDLVASVPDGIKRATLTNSNSVHWDRLNDFGLGVVFDHYFASHLTGLLKPDLEAFEHCANVLACDPTTILYLDDLSMNCTAAKKVGFLVAQVNGVTEARAALTAFDIL